MRSTLIIATLTLGILAAPLPTEQARDPAVIERTTRVLADGTTYYTREADPESLDDEASSIEAREPLTDFPRAGGQRRDPDPGYARPVKERDPEPGYARPVKERDPEPGYARPVKERDPEPGYARPVKERDPEPGYARPVKQRDAEPGYARPVKERDAEPGYARAVKERDAEPGYARPVRRDVELYV
ncbi:hypothetical protein K458DRAFT_420571 [Lentithecium fluviatile CBS 122367]|uniref:Uncharacterized protein n=1 Tax=Lentithecium fluviatile CBS 122367 TaxID=1168545 RepID=A0A6G1IUH5_9PLEO|nr:hypothetical protein K458DRAFT_420571 [Lentithecium fluviatile CBS 122367]